MKNTYAKPELEVLEIKSSPVVITASDDDIDLPGIDL